jgi:hypothetical protein
MTTEQDRIEAGGEARERRDEVVAQLRFATLPSLLSPIAVHHWFVVLDPETGDRERWEVWQERDRGGESWAHVHRNLMHPDRGVGGGPCMIAAEWRGEAARAVRSALLEAPRYPFRAKYRFWPGPNSNTFAAWVLERAGVEEPLDPRAIGKDYLGLFGVRISRRPFRLQLETPLFGFRLAPRGLECRLLCLTCGFYLRPPGILTPLGRLPLRARPRA